MVYRFLQAQEILISRGWVNRRSEKGGGPAKSQDPDRLLRAATEPGTPL